VVDNARYYKCKLVNEFLESSKVSLVFLPPYSPNLNLIERLWRVLNRNIIYNKYYEKYEDFKKSVIGFFDNFKDYQEEISRVINFKFQILGS
jgi:transposase